MLVFCYVDVVIYCSNLVFLSKPLLWLLYIFDSAVCLKQLSIPKTFTIKLFIVIGLNVILLDWVLM